MQIRTDQTLRSKKFCAVLSLMLIVSVLSIAQLKPETQETSMSQTLLKPGKLITEGRNKTPLTSKRLLTYRLEEVTLPKPLELQIRGRQEIFNSALRLTITSELIQGSYIIWVDDAALGAAELAGKGIASLIYDRSILRNGAALAVSDHNGSDFFSLPERLELPDDFRATIKPATLEDGNSYTIRTVLRVKGSVRQALVEIALRTNRPFPVGNNTMYVQLGKRFLPFSGFGQLGQVNPGELVVSLTPVEFGQLKNGDWLMATYGAPIPGRSGIGGAFIWEFGPLEKSRLDR